MYLWERQLGKKIADSELTGTPEKKKILVATDHTVLIIILSKIFIQSIILILILIPKFNLIINYNFKHNLNPNTNHNSKL